MSTASRSDEFHLKPVSVDDFEELFEIRMEAMRESLENLGRFDPARVRDRLRNSFHPKHTKIISVGGRNIGFFTLRPTETGMYLDHFYVRPANQSGGIGSRVLRGLLTETDKQGMDVRLRALRGSRSNEFYRRFGFLPEAEEEFDVPYLRMAQPGCGIVRFARPDDIASVVSIYNQAIQEGQRTGDTTPVTAEDRGVWFAQHDETCHPVWVSEIAGRVAGYLSLSSYRPGRMALRHTVEVSMYVDSGFRGRGVASCLLRESIRFAREHDFKTLFAIVIDSNMPSIALLEKSGFEKWGHLPRVLDFDGVELGHLYYGLRVQA